MQAHFGSNWLNVLDSKHFKHILNQIDRIFQFGNIANRFRTKLVEFLALTTLQIHLGLNW